MLNWITTSKFGGLNSLRTADEIQRGEGALTLNSDHSSSSSLGPLEGYSLFGNQVNTDDNIVRKFTYFRGEDTQVQLQVRDDGSNYIVEYLNTEDVRNSTNGEWSILEAGLTRIITLLDGTTKKAKIDFAPFNDTGTNQLVYGNQVEAPRIWNGATATIASTTSTTVVIAGTRTCAQRGFAATGDIIINGTVYTYTDITDKTFTVTTDPTGEANGSGIAQAVDSTTLSTVDKAGIFLSANQRIFLAGITATPNQVTFSDVGDLTSYSGSDPSSGGFEDFPQLNGPVTALSYLGEWTIVFSYFKILAFKFEFPTSTTRITIMKEIANEGCVNWKAVEKIGDRVIYLTPKGGIKQITQIATDDVFNVQDITTKIRPSIKNFIWNDASLTYFSRDQILIAAGQSNDTVGVNDKAIALQFSQNETGLEMINLGIIDWFIGDMTVYNEELHWGSSVESRSFKAFDGFSKNGAPYIWIRTEKIETYPELGGQFNRKRVLYLGVTGLIATGTTLEIELAYDTNASTALQQMSLVGTDTGYIVFQPLNTLGSFALGTEPLGGTRTDVEDMNPFFVVFALPNEYLPYSTQLTFKTDGVGQNVQINSYAFAVEDAEQHVDKIKNVG